MGSQLLEVLGVGRASSRAHGDGKHLVGSGVVEHHGVRDLHGRRHLCDVVRVEGAGGGAAEAVAGGVGGAGRWWRRRARGGG